MLQRHHRVFAQAFRPCRVAIDNFQARRPQARDDLAHILPDFGLDRDVETPFRREGDGRFASRAPGGKRNAVRVARIEPREDRKRHGRFGDGPRDRADAGNPGHGLLETRPIGDGAETGFEPDQSGMRGRTAARSARVGADRQGHEPAGYRGHGSAG